MPSPVVLQTGRAWDNGKGSCEFLQQLPVIGASNLRSQLGQGTVNQAVGWPVDAQFVMRDIEPRLIHQIFPKMFAEKDSPTQMRQVFLHRPVASGETATNQSIQPVYEAFRPRQSLVCGQGFQALVEAALVAGGLVWVNDAFAGHGVDDGLGFLVGGCGLLRVAGIQCAHGLGDG